MHARIVPLEWHDKAYREAAMEAETSNGIAWQVRVNREERGWTQKELAHRASTGQPAISKLEDPEGGDVRVSTLIKVAHAFECALSIQFVSYSVLAQRTADVRPDRMLACGFDDEQSSSPKAPVLLYMHDLEHLFPHSAHTTNFLSMHPAEEVAIDDPK